MIATRHHDHGAATLAARRRGNYVYVEKPLALTVDDSYSLANELSNRSRQHILMVFNRRFAVLDDFRNMRLFDASESGRRIRATQQYKGQKTMLTRLIQSIKSGKPPVSAELLSASSLAALLCLESLSAGHRLGVPRLGAL